MSESKALKVIAGAPDRPLVIGDIEIPCYVLEGEQRVLSESGLFHGLGAKRGGSSGGADMPRIMASKAISPFVSNELAAVLTSPIEFQPPRGGRTAYGYPAEVLEGIIDVILEARQAGALPERYAHIVQRAHVLNRGLRRIGIIGLIDEATGYQRIREERALATILEKFIAKELQPWTRTFPYEFYELLYKLRGWPGPDGNKRTPQVGKDTNDIVYERLAPGVLDELRRLTPKTPAGNRSHRFFQWFTPDHGHPKLKEHLAAVMALMRAAPNWTVFRRLLNRAFPKLNETIPLPFGDDV